jgi:hypothetical protein
VISASEAVVAKREPVEPTETEIDDFHAWRAKRLLIAGLLLTSVGAGAIAAAVTVLHSDLLGNFGLAGVWFGAVISVLGLVQRSTRIKRGRNK